MNPLLLTYDALEGLRLLDDESVHCCVTSPPYWGHRDYGVPGQLGLEPTPEEYVAHLVEVFSEVRRVMRPDATLWLNLGDSYAASRSGPIGDRSGLDGGQSSQKASRRAVNAQRAPNRPSSRWSYEPWGIKPKDLVGIPWRVAFALQADGWWLRSDIVWSKPNPMPESVTDRPTKAHEYVFLLTKSARYFYDAEAVREEYTTNKPRGRITGRSTQGFSAARGGDRDNSGGFPSKSTGRNARSVWTITTKPFPEAHFATFPPELPERCIRAGTSERGCCPECGAPWERVTGDPVRVPGMRGSGNKDRKVADGTRARLDTHLGSSVPWEPTVTPTTGWRPTCDHETDPTPCTVLDPFSGAATTGLVALQEGRRYIGIELNAEYQGIARRRLAEVQPNIP